jgi:serine/threonine-protein kinase
MAAGRLVYQPGGRVAGNQLAWYGRNGERLGAVGEPGSLYGPRVSPDGSRIALDISGDSNQGDIWVLDSERGSGSRVTVWPEDDSYPIWSPDGEELMFSSTRGEGIFKLYRVDFQGGTEPELVLDKEGGDVVPGAWPSDGTRVFFSHATEGQIWELDTETGETRSVIESGFTKGDFSVSPDGSWITYDSNETGQSEVYLASLPQGEQRARVSTEGGKAPLWARDGSEIFFMSPHSDAILRASVSFEAGRPVIGRVEKLIGVEMKVHSKRQFDTVDGQRFLLNTSVNSGARTPLTLITNWRQEP